MSSSISPVNIKQLLHRLQTNDPKLQELNLFNQKIEPQDLKALSVALSTNNVVTKVKLFRCALDDKAALTLTEMIRANKSITELDLSDLPEKDYGAGYFIKSKAGNNIGDRGANALAEALKFNHTLKVVDLNYNDISHRVATEIRKSGIIKLTMREDKESPKTQNPVDSILPRLYANDSTLTELDFTGKNIGDEGVKALAEALKVNTRLKKLKLSGCSVYIAGAEALAEAITKNHTLEELDLGEPIEWVVKGEYLKNDYGNNVEDKGGLALAEALKKKHTLKRLDLENNSISSKVAIEIRKSGIIKITLPEDDKDSQYLNRFQKLVKDLKLNNPPIKYLHMSFVYLGDEGTRDLAEALKVNHTVEELHLYQCGIGDDGAKALAEALKFNNHLRELNLGVATRIAEGNHQTLPNIEDFNHIGDVGAEAFLEVRKVNKTLRKLNLKNNKISPSMAVKLKQSHIEVEIPQLAERSTLKEMIDVAINKAYHLKGQSFYDASITREESEKRLLQKGIVGAFILRRSSQPGKTVVSFLSKPNEVVHSLLQIEKLHVQEENGNSYPSLENYFQNHQKLFKEPLSVVSQDIKTGLSTQSSQSIPSNHDKSSKEPLPFISQNTYGELPTSQSSKPIPSPSSPSITSIPTTSMELSASTGQQLLEQLKTRQRHNTLRLNASPQTELKHLMDEEKRIKDVLKTISSQRSILENKIQAIEKMGSFAQQLLNLQEQLQKIVSQTSAMQKEYEAVAIKREAIEAFKADDNLWNFYRTINITIEEIFIGCKAVASDFIDTSLTGNLNTAAVGVTIFGKLASLIPMIGNSLDTAIGAINNVLQNIDHQRQTNLLKSISGLGTLSDIEMAAEGIARQLTQSYHEQLKVLLPIEEAKQERSKIAHLWQKGKEIILDEKANSQAEMVANYGVMQILSALLDGSIQDEGSLDVQFFKAVTAPPSGSDRVKNVVHEKLGIGSLIARENKRWYLHEFFYKPGIRTSERRYYSGKPSNPSLYGYRLGSLEEVNALGFTEVHNAAAKPSTESIKVAPQPTPKKESTADKAASSSVLSKPPADMDSVKNLQEQQKEMQVKLETHEREMAESKKRQAQLEKLLKGPANLNIDLSSGDQTYVSLQNINISAQSNHYSPSYRQLATEHEQLKNLVAKLAQHIAVLNDSLGIQMEPEKQDTTLREQLLSTEDSDEVRESLA